MTNTLLHLAGTETLAGLIARLADNKFLLGRRYAEWCSSAPTLESSVAAAAMAQDELGHARALYPVLKDLQPDGGAEVDPETRTHFVNLAALDADFVGWQDFVAANFLIDTAITLIFEAGVGSSFEPLAGRSRKVLQEERLHRLHGEGWVKRMAQEGGGVRRALETSLARVWPEVLCWFGPNSPTDTDDTLAATGVLDATPDALRARFLAAVGPVIAANKVALPVRRAGDDGWELTEPLPWGRFDAATYRLRPATATATRAPRGKHHAQ